jgi:hypothetical protein
MAMDISGINFFMPVFGFLFVFLIVYAVLFKTKILGDNKFVQVLVSFVIAVIFMSFSSLDLYVKTITAWFVVLLVIVFFILMLIGFSDTTKIIMKPFFAWIIVIVLIFFFLVAAIKVFNPVFHSGTLIEQGSGDNNAFTQLKDFLGTPKVFGSILLLVIALLVSWVITKK